MHSAESLLKRSETASILFTGDRCEKVKLTEYWEGKIFGKFSPVTVICRVTAWPIYSRFDYMILYLLPLREA